jgi:hypothetical protein
LIIVLILEQNKKKVADPHSSLITPLDDTADRWYDAFSTDRILLTTSEIYHD